MLTIKFKRIRDIQPLIENLKYNKIRFRIEQSNLTRKIFLENGQKFICYGNRKLLKTNELYFINKVKKYVAENVNPLLFPNFTARNILFTKKNEKLRKNFLYKNDEIFEIDLTAAYWELARMTGIISNEIYELGLSPKISKRARLASLGVLAKNTFIYTFNGLAYDKPIHAPPLLTSRLFFFCACGCVDMMQEAEYFLMSDFYFYWVDAVFFKGKKNCEFLADFLIRNGIKKVKIKKIETIKLTGSTITTTHLNEKKQIETRSFNFKKENFSTIEKVNNKNKKIKKNKNEKQI